jgi:hypothetical protein
LPACSDKAIVTNNRYAPFALAIDGGYLYWLEAVINAGSVYSCPVNGCGGAPQTIAATPAKPQALSVLGGDVYFTSGTDGDTDGTVAYYFFAVGVTTVEARQRRTPTSIVTDGKDMYWTEQGTGNDGQVVGCQVNFGGLCDSTMRVLAANLPFPTAITMSSDTVYWVNRGPAATASGSVMSARR